jgi:RNA polymerase-binding transcription factor DksA
VRVTRISIALEQRLGDNDYGSERAQVEYTAELGAEDDAVDCTQKLLWHARVQLFHELSNSRTLAIRRKANPPARLCAECKQPLGDEDDYRHPACEEAMLERRKQQEEERRAKYEEERKEREAEYQRQRELAGVGASTDDNADDEPDDDEDLPL